MRQFRWNILSSGEVQLWGFYASGLKEKLQAKLFESYSLNSYHLALSVNIHGYVYAF